MRKIAYSSAILIGALLVSIAIGLMPRSVATSQGMTNKTMDVRTLGETIDMKALPQQKIPEEVYH